MYLVTCMRKAFMNAVFTFRVEAPDICEAAIVANKRIERVCLHEEVKTVMVERLR